MPKSNAFEYYICPRCNVGIRRKRKEEEEEYKIYFHKKCHEEIKELIEARAIFSRDQKIKLYEKAILKRIEPQICQRCNRKTEVVYKGANRCFYCNVNSFDPGLFINDVEQINKTEKIGENIALFKAIEDIPKHFFEAQKRGFMIIFQTQNPLTQDNLYLVWRIPD